MQYIYIHSQLSLPVAVEGQWYAWAVVVKKLNKLVGYIEWKISNKHFAQAEIGWALHSDYRGKGYAFEAAHACLEHGFSALHLHRITATCDPQNTRSIHLAEKLGMTREGRMREVIRKDGAWRDLLLYAILSHEWPPPNNVKGYHSVT